MSAGKTGTDLMLADASDPGSEPALIANFPGSVSNLKVRALRNGNFALACSAPVTRDGKMANPADKPAPHSTARVHTSLFVRQWDTWVEDTANAIWYGCLQKEDTPKLDNHVGSAYELLPKTGLVNALAGTGLASPVPPFGGTDDFDIGPCCLAFVAKDPLICPATHTKTDLYVLHIADFASPDPAEEPRPVDTGPLCGYSASPAFSHRGDRLVFTRMRSNQYESDKPRLMLVERLDGKHLSREVPESSEFYQTDLGEGGWDARPERPVWSADDSELYVTAEEHGRSKLWKLSAQPSRGMDQLPVALTSEGSVSEVSLLADGSDKLFVTSSSLVDNSCYSILDPASGNTETVSSGSKHGKTFGLSKTQFDEFWFKGAGDYNLHALVMKPSDFDESKRYPLALLIHGGPQGAWTDGWSSRWNPAIFAEQGYIVVSPNPTGSTGYGMALQNGIKGQWGGRPYNDLVNCFEHIEDNMPYVDTRNAVALGASYGGYMISKSRLRPP